MWFQESKRMVTRLLPEPLVCALAVDGRDAERSRAGEARHSDASLFQEVAARALVRWPLFLLDHCFLVVLLFLHRFLLPGFSPGLLSACFPVRF